MCCKIIFRFAYLTQFKPLLGCEKLSVSKVTKVEIDIKIALQTVSSVHMYDSPFLDDTTILERNQSKLCQCVGSI